MWSTLTILTKASGGLTTTAIALLSDKLSHSSPTTYTELCYYLYRTLLQHNEQNFEIIFLCIFLLHQTVKSVRENICSKNIYSISTMDQRMLHVMGTEQCSVKYSCACEYHISSEGGMREFWIEEVWLETWHHDFSAIWPWESHSSKTLAASSINSGW